MAVQVVHSGGGPVSVNVTTTPAISITSPQVSVVDVNPVYTSGQPGDTGPQGPQGPAGNDGADGVTVTYTLSAQNGANTDEEKVRIAGSDGNSSEVVFEAGTNLSIARDNDKITFASTVTDAVLESDTSTSGFGFVVDDDTMNNASDTKVPTQQSVKAYVDNNVTSANVTTNLATSYQTDRVTVTSSDGTDAVILEATGSQAGVMSVDMHDKLDSIASNADATTSSNVNAAGAIMHTDVAGSATGLITRAGSEQYTVVAASTSNISEGSNLYYTDARADARVSAVIDTDSTLGSPSDTLVPSQAAIKTYVDNQLGTQNLSLGTKTGTTVAIDISGGGSSVTIPASTTSEAGLMTEAQFDKLAAIEDNADVTDATNVAAAGALMDSEVTNLAQVKAFDSSDYATAAQGTTADNALPKAGGTMTGNITFSGTQTVDGRDLSADGAKLDNIEANADVTDTANVTAAGALMDSEVTNLAQVKAFDSSDYATSAQGTTADNALPKSGGQMTGNITFSGSQTVDGRDLSVDGAKLDNIEANATADQTNDEIRAAVEAANNSNVFTDADHSKLNAIEDNADVTDSNNVVAALVSATSISGGNQTSIKSNLGITDPAATNNLSDVSTGGSANGQLLIYDAVTNTYDPATLTEGSNITITEGAGSITIASTASGGASALDDLSDVTISGSVAGNQYLVHNGNSDFVNQALDISHDTDPDLGGDLDVGDHSIVTSTGDKDITLTPHGTGQVKLGTYPIKADDTAPDSGDNLKVLTYVHGDSEIRLVSNPQGTVTTPSSPAPSSTQIAAFTATADQITGFDTFTIDGSGFTTPNVLVKQGTLSAPGRYGSGSRVTRTMFTDANANKTAGDVYVMNSSASVWTAKADADAESTASGLLAVAGSTQSASGMVLSGIVRVDDNSGFSNADRGDILYLHTDAGHVSDSKPTGSGKVVRIVGYVVHPGTQAGDDGVIYFDPSKDYITLSQ